MAKEQTFIIKLEDVDGRTVEFERFAYKRYQTCVRNMAALYSGKYGAAFLYEKALQAAVRIVCYSTPYGQKEIPAWSATVEEFREIMKKCA